MSGIEIDLIDPNDFRWGRQLAQCTHDIYSTQQWAETHESLEGGFACGLRTRVGEEALIVPLVRREIYQGLWDATSPYGYPGYVATSGLSHSDLSTAFSAIRSWLRARGCVSMFLRLHPVLNRCQTIEADRIVSHGPTIAVNLDQDRDAWWQGVRRGIRRDVALSTRRGLLVSRSNDPGDYERFAKIYSETMGRQESSPYHQRSESYFQNLAKLFGESIQLWKASFEGNMIGGALFSISPSAGVAQYLYSATSTEHLHFQPSKAILVGFIEMYLSNTKISLLHLGGGVGGAADSLLNFKRGFGGFEFSFVTARYVLNADTYQMLSNDQSAKLDGGAGLELSGFFPAYRSVQQSSNL